MGWIFSLAFLILYWMNGTTELLIPAGLFAIAGAIAFASNKK